MTWTDPRTWTVGEVVTAAQMNTHLRDNLNAIGAHVRVRKAADTNTATDATVNDDPDLQFAVAANEVWIVELVAVFTAGASGGTRRTITGPAGSSGMWREDFNSVHGPATALASERANLAAVTDEPCVIHAVIVNGATPGTARLQWAQQTSNATNTTVKANSFLLAHRVA